MFLFPVFHNLAFFLFLDYSVVGPFTQLLVSESLPTDLEDICITPLTNVDANNNIYSDLDVALSIGSVFGIKSASSNQLRERMQSDTGNHQHF